MKNMIDYVKKYKDKDFYEEDFNEVDNLVFANLVYLNFKDIVPKNRKYITIKEAGEIFLKNNKYRDVSKIGIPQRDAYNLLKAVVKTKRYSDVRMYNYTYQSDINKQFSAVTFRYKRGSIYISFEGTDNLLSGWKEDFNMLHMFPIPSQTLAIDYLNRGAKFLDRNIIIGGHSKGGNLAQVAAMYAKWSIRHRIKKIYNNDGPGLRKAQIESIEYKRIEDKLIHIIPNYSMVGILLRNDKNKYKVVKSSKRTILAHAALTWQIEDKNFVTTNLSKTSSSLEEGFIKWLDKNDDKKREKAVTSVFKALEDNGFVTIFELIDIRKLNKIIKSIKSLDDETKEIAMDFIKFNIGYVIENRKKDNIK